MTSSLFFSKTNNLGFHSEFKKKISLSLGQSHHFSRVERRAREKLNHPTLARAADLSANKSEGRRALHVYRFAFGFFKEKRT